MTRGYRSYTSGLLDQRVRLADDQLESCELCPRTCRVNRKAGETGHCGTAGRAVIASYSPHFGEEQPLVGRHGSGTIFISGCGLGCCFCQNFDISNHPEYGTEVDDQTFASIMIDLQDQGCHNINFVTPSHVLPQILAALPLAYKNGLRLPLVYNCSGYESVHSLRLLDGIIDIYLPDAKFWDEASAARYADAPDYPAFARAALVEMHRQVGDLRLDQEGIAVEGLLVRHLLMPDGFDEAKRILDFIAAELSVATYVNIMDQYRPCGNADRHPELRTSIAPDQLRQAQSYAKEIGLTRIDSRDLAVLLKRLGIV
ncbi:MAG: radical SAM protein [Desulfofustis sp.]